mmetsp:Transcript_25966/g.36269  ORF Transcript_25966/g.36269 Transcript_25966/m.36269 type:complete len:100 (-) Transcript_25966:35-334(-)
MEPNGDKLLERAVSDFLIRVRTLEENLPLIESEKALDCSVENLESGNYDNDGDSEEEKENSAKSAEGKSISDARDLLRIIRQQVCLEDDEKHQGNDCLA